MPLAFRRGSGESRVFRRNAGISVAREARGRGYFFATGGLRAIFFLAALCSLAVACSGGVHSPSCAWQQSTVDTLEDGRRRVGDRLAENQPIAGLTRRGFPCSSGGGRGGGEKGGPELDLRARWDVGSWPEETGTMPCRRRGRTWVVCWKRTVDLARQNPTFSRAGG